MLSQPTALEPAGGAPPSGSALLLRFVHRLRTAGIPVSMVEAIDAAQALGQLDLTRRGEVKHALAAALIKQAKWMPDFEALFDAFFSRTPPAQPGQAPTSLAEGGGGAPGEGQEDEPSERMPSEDMLEELLAALRSGDMEALRFLAMAAAGQFGGITAASSETERYYMYRILRQLDLSKLLSRALEEDRRDGLTALDGRLSRDEQMRRIEEFRKLIAEAIRARLARLAGLQQAAESASPEQIEEVDFLGASPEQLRQMRQAIQPLARKLAARMAHRQRQRRLGRLDVRRTMRRSLSSGGVPLEPAFRRPKRSRPDLCMLCDVSGSVAEFAEFTLNFLNAMNAEFSRIRCFAFIDGVDDVTDLFADGRIANVKQLLWRRQLVWADGHSDYEHVFSEFRDRHGRASVGPKTTLIVTGDARNNFKGEDTGAFRELAHQARRLVWLNPEARVEWDVGDSVMSRYAPWCQGVHEVRNLRQLAEFVLRLEA